MIELRDRQVLALPPFAAPIVRIPHAAIVTNKDRNLRSFDKRVDALCVRRCNSNRDSTVWFFRKPFISHRRNLRPAVAAVSRPKQSAGRRRSRTIAARAILPPFTPKIPQTREHYVRIRRIDRDISATGGKIRTFENLRPCLASVRSLVKAAIR